MGCVKSKKGFGTLSTPPSPSSKSTRDGSGSVAADAEVKVDYDMDKAVDNLQAEKKIFRALAAKRRGDIFDESFEPPTYKTFTKPLIEKSKELHKFLKAALHENILFRDLGDEQMQQVLNALTCKSVDANTKIIKQGETGDIFYIVEEGEFTFYVDGEKRGACSAGDSFGELALLYNSKRAATVQSDTHAEVWCLERSVFRKIVAGAVDAKQVEIKKALRKVSILNSLTDEQINRLSDAVETVHFKANETIIVKGDDGNLFYMIKSGRVSCTKAGKNESAAEVILEAGNYFGEVALLKDKSRAANVIAKEDTECLVLDGEAFHLLLGSLKDVMDYNLGTRVLASIPILSHLSKTERKKLMKALKEEKFSEGDVIIQQGDSGSKFYIIKDGTCKVTKQVEEEEADVAELHPSDYFGERALLKDEPRAANVIASSPVTVCLTMERNAFEKLLGPLQKIMKRELDTRDDEIDALVKKKTQAIESTLKLGDLKMLKTLGTGTFGRVKLVEVPKLKKTYALKILQKAQVVAYRQQTNVMNEKNILMECDHPFILRLYRTFKDKHKLYLLLELVLGGELFSLLHLKGGALSTNDARFYSACVVDGLEYLHNKSIVYRDLKPENLMIDSVGYIKIVDFGFAKKVTAKTYTLCGTPEYLAPELVLGKGHSFPVDTWAVGILIFEMLTGSSPFADPENSDHMVICKNIVRGKVDYPRKFNDKAKDLVSRLLVREAHLRLGSLKGGTGEIKEHVFFKSVDWNELVRKRMKAVPWIPPIKNDFDTSNFDHYEEDEHFEPYKPNGSNWDANF